MHRTRPTLLVEATAVGTAVAGLAEGLRLVGAGGGALVAGLGLWAPLAPLTLVGLVGVLLFLRSAPMRAMGRDDGPATAAASAILLGWTLAAVGFGAGRLAGRAVDILEQMHLIDPVLAVGTMGIGLGAIGLGFLAVAPLARLLGRLSARKRHLSTALLALTPPAIVLTMGARPLLRGSSTWPGVLAAIAVGAALLWLYVGPRLGRGPTRRRALSMLAALTALGVAGILTYGGIDDARGAIDDSQGLARFTGRVVIGLADRDGDGFAGLGGADCDDSDPDINPLAVDRPGNGIDEDCDGADRVADTRPQPLAEHHPLPADFVRPRNLLLITVDTVRADRLSLYGHDRPTSPRIDALGAEAAVFERAYPAANQTRHALPTLHAGRHLDFMETDRRGYSVIFVQGNHFLLERLDAAGRATEAHASHYFNHLLHQGLGQGIGRVVVVKQKVRSPLSAPDITDNAIAGLDRNRGRPWAMWVHYTEPHAPYQAHEGIHFGDDPIDLYDGEILRVDREIGRLLDALETRGLSDSTAIVLTSDHGEEFGEHGREFHGKQLYEESIRVPLIIRAPGLKPSRVAEPVSLVDVSPTVANLMGLPPAPTFGGRSLVARMLGAAEADPKRAIYVDCIWHDDRPAERQLAVLRGRYKLVYDVRNGHARLFDLVDDPGEKRPVHGAHPEITAELRELARQQIAAYQQTTLDQLMGRRVSDRPPADITGPPVDLAPGLRLHGSRIERVSPHLPLYGASLFIEATGATRPDYVLRFEWFDRRDQRVAQRDVRPLAGRHPTHRWQTGEVVEVVNHARIQRGKAPYSVKLTLLDGGQPVGEPATVGSIRR